MSIYDHGDPYVEWNEANAANEDGQAVIDAERRAAEEDAASEFEIRYTILRNGEEIGFGAGLGDTVDVAAWVVSTDIATRRWETQPGMPDPGTITASTAGED